MVQCLVPRVNTGPVDAVPTLATDAITEGDERLVCEQARGFSCEARKK